MGKQTCNFDCRICNRKVKGAKKKNYYEDGSKFCFLGIKGSSRKFVSNSSRKFVCNSVTRRGRLISLPTHISILRENSSSFKPRQQGLFTSKSFQKNEVIARYHGKKLWRGDLEKFDSSYTWSTSDGFVIDAKHSRCIVK